MDGDDGGGGLLEFIGNLIKGWSEKASKLIDD